MAASNKDRKASSTVADLRLPEQRAALRDESRRGPSQSRPLTETSPGRMRTSGRLIIAWGKVARAITTHMLRFERKASPFCARYTKWGDRGAFGSRMLGKQAAD
jgi:hypothetical protein